MTIKLLREIITMRRYSKDKKLDIVEFRNKSELKKDKTYWKLHQYAEVRYFLLKEIEELKSFN